MKQGFLISALCREPEVRCAFVPLCDKNGSKFRGSNIHAFVVGLSRRPLAHCGEMV